MEGGQHAGNRMDDPRRVAIYARYSKPSQPRRSLADQIAICREHAERQGWEVVEMYTDPEASGATMIEREGLQRLIQHSEEGRFDTVLAEALDRISRNQAHVAGIWQSLRWQHVDVVTLFEGMIEEVHIGLSGAFAAVYRRNIAEKTRRGLAGRVRDGITVGRPPYGYEAWYGVDASGQPLRGRRRIVPEAAAVILRIFEEYAAGAATSEIADSLNADEIPAPSGGKWRPARLINPRLHGPGILDHPAYIGLLRHGLTRLERHPDTGRLRYTPQPEETWITSSVPQLRIVPQELWNKVRERRDAEYLRRSGLGPRRPKPLTGLVTCAGCGRPMQVLGSERYRCSTVRRKGRSACPSARTAPVALLEESLAELLVKHLRQHPPDWKAELRGLRAECKRARRECEARVADLDRRYDNLLAAVEAGVKTSRIYDRIRELDQQRRDAASVGQTPDLPDSISRGFDRALRKEIVRLGYVVEKGEPAPRDLALGKLARFTARYVVHPAKGKARGVTPVAALDLRDCLLLMAETPD